MWKCFKTVIVKVFHSDKLKKSSKVIHVEVFQNSHCQSVQSDNLKKGSKEMIVEVFQNSHCQSVSKWQP